MINIWIVLGILFFHWVFDFVCQSHKESINKSSSWIYLLSHTAKYSALWIPIISLYLINSTVFTPALMLFPIITFVAHTATDYYTSRVNSALWKEGKIHDFFVSIGFDQFLHFVQLLLTFYLLT